MKPQLAELNKRVKLCHNAPIENIIFHTGHLSVNEKEISSKCDSQERRKSTA